MNNRHTTNPDSISPLPGRGGQQELFPPTILVVDDDPRVLGSLSAMLQLSGYDVTCAANGREALDLLGTRGFDLVLLDINLPMISGQGVLDFMVERNIDTDVIVLSGESTFDQATQAFRKGAVDFLAKPCPPERLLATVAGILRKRQRKNDYFLIQKRLQGSEELHRFIVNSAPDLFFMLDEQGCFSFVNERAESLLGCRIDDILGKHFSEIVYEKDREKARYAFNLVQHPGRQSSKRIELRLRMKDSDDLRYVEVRAIAIALTPMGIYAADGRNKGVAVGTYGVARDIGDRKQSAALLRYHRYHDVLTSLPNRTLLDDRLEIALGQAKRAGGKLALMSLDVDRFKKINETFGHLAGDELLQAVALKLKKCLREGDTLARVGGDEFILLLPGIARPEDATVIAQKILAVGSQPFYHQNQELRITFSIGVVIYPDHGENKETLLRHADLALYRVKSTGRNGFRHYSNDLEQHGGRGLDLETSLLRAIGQNELRLYYQPQIDMARGRVVGLEALIRWQHPQRGLLPPSDFIPLAEETKLICDIGDWVLRQACKDAAVLKELGHGDIKIAINVSPQQFEMDDFDQVVLKTIGRHGLDNQFLEIEITENSIMRDMNKSMATLTALANEGVTIAVDDFGTGYSSLGYLHSLPLHTLKLDRFFVQNIAQAGERNTIITAVLAMAQGLEMEFIAEGVECQAQHDYLLAAGCAIGQGYHYSRPLEFPKLLSFLAANPS